MKVGVIGSGAIGPDLAYGFVSALAKTPDARVYLVDIRQEALDAGVARIRGYVGKGVARGKLSAKAAAGIDNKLIPTLELADLADCDYVLEAATEDLAIKRKILASVEAVVSADCLIGFATSGIPRRQIAADAKHPDRCFVNHPFYPAWRSPPVEVVSGSDAALEKRMLDTLRLLGKVPVATADVECFAADDVFCNYCSEAARIVAEGVATPAQVDKIVNDAVGGGGPFNVLDLTKGNLLTAHCQELMRDAATGSTWFEPPAILRERGDAPWHDRNAPGDANYAEDLKTVVLDRMLAVLLGRTIWVVDNDVCDAERMDWMTRTALGFYPRGLLEVAHDLGAERVHELVTNFAAENPGFPIPSSVANKTLPALRTSVLVDRDGDIATITVFRPESLNALNGKTVAAIGQALGELDADPAINGVVLTGWDGPLAGADVMELSGLTSRDELRALVAAGQSVLNGIAHLNTPVVAALDGPVMGGGAELSMACHARVVGKRLVMAQPEVKLGIIPGYGGSQRLPRLIGMERGLDLLRTGRAVGAKEACAWGWATGEPVADPIGAAKALLREHIDGKIQLKTVDPAPMHVPAPLPTLALGQASRSIDKIIVDVCRDGLSKPLLEGLAVEAEGAARCFDCVDWDIGMKNFIQNGPRIPAMFLHE